MVGNSMGRMLGLFIAMVAMLILTGCASTVQITSNPPGASVTVDGQYVGETPTSYTDTAIVFTRRQVEVQKEGYQDVRTTISRDGQVNVGALVGGILCLWPLLLWAMDYPTTVNYDLRPAGMADGFDGFDSFAWDLEEGPTVSYRLVD